MRVTVRIIYVQVGTIIYNFLVISLALSSDNYIIINKAPALG